MILLLAFVICINIIVFTLEKAKPKTIIDIAKLLQQKAKETKEKKQSVITASALKSASSPTKPTATPHQLKDQSDAKEIIISNAKVQTSTSNLPTEDAVDSYTALCVVLSGMGFCVCVCEGKRKKER